MNKASTAPVASAAVPGFKSILIKRKSVGDMRWSAISWRKPSSHGRPRCTLMRLPFSSARDVARELVGTSRNWSVPRPAGTITCVRTPPALRMTDGKSPYAAMSMRPLANASFMVAPVSPVTGSHSSRTPRCFSSRASQPSCCTR
ncbi:hypothetical protein D3C72_1589520 [compost metagenome]